MAEQPLKLNVILTRLKDLGLHVYTETREGDRSETSDIYRSEYDIKLKEKWGTAFAVRVQLEAAALTEVDQNVDYQFDW